MLKFLTLIPIIYLLIWQADGQSFGSEKELEACRKSPTYSIKNKKDMTIKLYYDVDHAAIDFAFVKALCKAKKTLKHIKVEFYPGISTHLKANILTCYHADENNTDCTDSFAAACASKIVDVFPHFVCCTAGGKSAADCVKDAKPDKVEEFNQCVQGKDPKIKPQDILLANRAAAKKIYPPWDALPIVTFDGALDACARLTLPDKPIEVICAMLAEGVDDACKKSN